MTVQISQRGKEYLETARTLLRAAQTMTDSAIAGQLKALAEAASHPRPLGQIGEAREDTDSIVDRQTPAPFAPWGGSVAREDRVTQGWRRCSRAVIGAPCNPSFACGMLACETRSARCGC